MGSVAVEDDRGLGAPASRAIAELRRTLEQARAEGVLTLEQIAACRDGFILLGAPMAEVVALVLDFAEPHWVPELLSPEPDLLERSEPGRRVARALLELESRSAVSGVHARLAESVREALSERPRPAPRVTSTGLSGLRPVPREAAQTPAPAQAPDSDESPSSDPRVLRLQSCKSRLEGW